MGLIGRDAELDAIVGLLDAARSGRSGAVLVRGEAGMGKSALLSAVIEHARTAGMRTREVRGVAGEVDFGFAALQRLLIPFMDGYSGLPGPQRAALGAAIGLTDASAPDRFLVGLAALTLLAETEPDRPKLLVVDDAHWLDRESLDTLLFVARRIQAESLAIVFGARPGGAFDGITTVELAGLSPEATTRLLSITSGSAVDPEVGRRVAAGSQGCPLAVVELVRDLSPGQLVGTIALPDPLPIGDRLEGLYLDRVRALPTATRQLLLIAAAEPGAHLATVSAAAATAGLTADALDAAQQAGLVDLDGTVTFRHPLVRSAVYRGAAPADRRRAHALLAQVTDPDVEPDAWVWHRARSVAAPDEEVASALEARGVEAERRGRYAAYATLLSRAAELTADPRARARRALTAANATVVAGAPGEAGVLLDRIRMEHAEPLVQVHAKRLRATLTSIGRLREALPLMLDAAHSAEHLDPALARLTYADGLFMLALASHLAPPGLAEELAASALAALEPADTSVIDDLVRALAERLTGDHARAVGLLRTSMRSMLRPDLPNAFLRWSSAGAMVAVELLDIDLFRRFSAAWADEARSRGALDRLRSTLGNQAQGELWCGRFDTAATMCEEAAEIARSMGDDVLVWRLLGAELYAWREDEAACRAIIDVIRSPALAETGNGLLINSAQLALTVLENSLGNYAAALEAAWPVFERDPVFQGGRILAEIVEAGHRCGRDDAATAALHRLGARSDAWGTAWAAGLHARATAIMAGEDAEPHFVRSISELERTPVRTDLARSHLLYGEWLRRQNRRRDARAELTTAHDMFVEMGAPRFASRAAREIAATGATVRRRSSAADTEPLTPQEEAIAQLAAGAATNRQIAAGLFLSASTVDYHLRKVYRKLGVDSRRKLRDALDQRPGR
ncbi:LuxR family transcriptional regulator [Pseudonocardia lacus]|uniref:LuxR family transcriptional regulator n=1 Tax=Pseudonocardia lacus TaxID=2835865 RepID=UPI001BDD6B35|nr:LuxR family transcriptional regulator [Pseudonocardia lacus]